MDGSSMVWYDQTTTVDGVKGNIRGGQQQLSIGTRRWLVITLIDCKGRTGGRGMSVGICIDWVAMRRVRDDGAFVRMWHHDAAGTSGQRMAAAASPGVCIADSNSRAVRASHRKPDRCCIAFTHKVPTRPPPLANRHPVRVQVPEHVARWLWLQLGPRRLAACVASAPQLRDRTLFVSSVRVDSGQCSDVLLSHRASEGASVVPPGLEVYYLLCTVVCGSVNGNW